MVGAPVTHRDATELQSYHRLNRRRVGVLAMMALGLLAACLLDMTTGPAGLAPGQIWAALTGAPDVPKGVQVIVWEVRLPVAIIAALVGAALALAGAEMQTVLENPLAEPFTLGISAAAALGAAVVIVFGLTLPGLPAVAAVSGNAFVFALAALLLLQLMGARGGGAEVLILFGIALNFAAGALLSLLQFVASADALQQLVFWTMGSLAAVGWPSVALMALVLAVVAPFSWRAAWQLTALRLGEDQARSFGIDVVRLRRLSLLRVGLLAATAVSMVGVIGFVGLAGPHIARMLLGEDHRFFLPGAVLTGALVMALASVLSKSLVGGVLLPVGLVTSLIGLPVFFSLIWRRGRA